jgi:3-phosphoshikimate 1-carboxyvinyltransferase
MSSFSDQALTLAAIAPYFNKPTTICGIAHVRGQECDRISAISQNLTAMGVKTEEFEDGITIYPSQPKAANINTFGDHRVAMSFAVTGLRADGIVIQNAEVCSKTFKEYFETLDGLIKSLTE